VLQAAKRRVSTTVSFATVGLNEQNRVRSVVQDGFCAERAIQNVLSRHRCDRQLWGAHQRDLPSTPQCDVGAPTLGRWDHRVPQVEIQEAADFV